MFTEPTIPRVCKIHFVFARNSQMTTDFGTFWATTTSVDIQLFSPCIFSKLSYIYVLDCEIISSDWNWRRSLTCLYNVASLQCVAAFGINGPILTKQGETREFIYLFKSAHNKRTCVTLQNKLSSVASDKTKKHTKEN